MATPEQLQELVGRIQAMEAGEAEGRAREQTLHASLQSLTTQLATAQQQAQQQQQQAATAAASTAGVQQPAGTVDTRALGKPEVFEGNETKWHDFRVVFKTYIYIYAGPLACGPHFRHVLL
eukprot:1569566-Amphidinium_carterae.1